MMRPFTCLLGRHDWRSEYDEANRQTTWTCQRCGTDKLTVDDMVNRGVDRGAGGASNINLYGGGGDGGG
jgi:hypothetical protein